MNTVEDKDDADFRARLAPLASEVLPPASTAEPSSASRLIPRQHVIAWVAAGAVVIVLGAASLLSRWPWSGNTRVDPGFAASAPRVELLSSGLPPKGATSDDNSSVTSPALPDPMVGLLLRRGDAALADGDIIAARMMYERAADLGSAVAATAAGKTYDIDFLLQAGARGIQPDQTAAAGWFRKAAALGDPEGSARLARIEGRPRP